jgi:hypothetical protein
MNDLERLLTEDVARLIDRIATSIPEGTVGRVRGSIPTLATRINDIDGRLAAARATLLDDYARWRQTLQDAEDIWALAAWRTAIADEPVTAPEAIAA